MRKILLGFGLLWSIAANAQFVPGQLLTAAELNTQFALYAPLAGASFAGSISAPSGTFTTGTFTNLSSSGTVSGVGFTNLLTPYALLASPTFTGTVSSNSSGSALTVGGGTPVSGSAAKFFFPTYFSNAATGVAAKFNRVQVGLEGLSSLDLLTGNLQTTQSWVHTYLPAAMAEAALAVTSTLGSEGIATAARTSDFRTAFGGASGGAAGIYGLGLNDDTGAGNPIACGVCGVVAQLSGVTGISLNQMDASNYGSVVDDFPNSNPTAGSVFSMGLTPGAYAATNNVTAAMYIGGGFSTSKFRKGLLVFNAGLDTTVGSGGGGVAVEMGLGQSLRWLNNSNATLAEIWGSSTGFNVLDNTTISGASSGNTLSLSNTSNTTNGSSILMTGNGATTPAKTLEVVNGQFQIQNNAGSGTVLSVTDAGNTAVNGSLNANGNDALLYSNTSAQSIPNNAATTITTWTKTFDRVNTNFNASTGTFTAPATGYYLVSGAVAFTAAAQTANTLYQLSVVANGVAVTVVPVRVQAAATFSPNVTLPETVVSLSSGQTVVLQVFQNSGSAQTLLNAAGVNTISINRIP